LVQNKLVHLSPFIATVQDLIYHQLSTTTTTCLAYRTAAAQELRDLAATVIVDQLDAIQNVLSELSLDSLSIDPTAFGTLQRVQEAAAGLKLVDWHVLIGLVPYTLLPVLFMASVLLLLMDDEQQQHQSNSPKQEEDPASTAKEEPPPSTPRREVVEVLQYYVMLPLYVLLIVLAWLVASACLVLAAFSRDVCLPNPDLNVLRPVQSCLVRIRFLPTKR
jgi:hypothetical protein